MRPKNTTLIAWSRLAGLTITLWFGAAAGVAWGQKTPEAKDRPEAAEQQEAPTFGANFNGAALEAVMEEYGKLTGLTPLIHPAIASRKVTITWTSRTKLTKKQYLEGIVIMLTYNGIALVPFNTKFVKVVAIDAARGSAMETLNTPTEEFASESDTVISRVIQFKNMEITEASKVIDALKSPNGKVQPLERINGVLITDSAANINRILEMLAHIDQPIETKEQFFIIPINNMKASEVKARLDDLIKDLTDKSTTTVPVGRPSPSGAPTMMPGVIRARPTAPAMSTDTTVATVEGDVEKGMVRGKVKIVADDRTGILIFITLPANMKFFEQVVQALDKDIKFIPDVLVRVYRMEFADAGEVAGMLNNLIGAAGKKDAAATAAAAAKAQPGTIPSSAGASTLQEYITERPAAEEIKDGLSQARKSKLGELAADNIKILPDKRTNALIVMATKSDQETIGELIKEMDMMLSQVLIEAVIIKIELTDSLKTGVQWLQNAMAVYDKKSGRKPVGSFAGAFGGGTDSQGAGGLPTPADAAGITALPGAAGLSYYLTHYGLNVSAVIQMASSDSRTKVVSTPVILTTDNTEATLKVTDQIYVYNGQKYTQVGSTVSPIADYTVKDVGLELKVKPHINTNKVVMMEISQSMSDPGSVGEPQAGGKVSSTRSLTASIAIRDRETIILGGQVRQDSGDSRFKVPILGDIPILGRLFNSTSQSGGRSEMIVLVTPYVLDTPGGISAESTRRKRALDLEGLWKRGEGEWTDSKIAEPNRKQAKIEAREARDLERAAKAEAARIAEEEEKVAAEKKKADAAAAKAAKEAARKAAAEAEKAEREARRLAEEEAARPKVNPVLLERMQRHQSEWSEKLKEVDKATATPEPGT
ncbi:MAG: type II secretion system secretin GspD [bacterium]